MLKEEKIKLLGLLLLYTLVFIPLLDAGFIWDDGDHFVHDPLQLKQGGLFDIWFSPNSGVWNYWPLSRTSFWLEHRLWGPSAVMAHIINWMLHGVSGLIFYSVLRLAKFRYAFMATGIFLLHPAVVESVAWITERKNVLSMFFAMLSLYSFMRLVLTENTKWVIACCFMFLLALLSKTSIVGLPIVFMTMISLLGFKLNKKIVICVVCCFFFAALAALTSFYFEENFIGSTSGLFDLDYLEKLALAGKVYGFYLFVFLNPFYVSFIYPGFDRLNPGIIDFLPLLSFAVITLAAVYLYIRKNIKWPLAFLIVYGVALFPVSGLFKVYGMRFTDVSDHWFYPAIAPTAVIFSWLLGSALQRTTDNINKLAVTILIILVVPVSHLHAGDFVSLKKLWMVTVQKNPEATLAQIGLCNIFLREGYVEKAEYHCNVAKSLDKGFPETLLNLGLIAGMKGDFQQAENYFLDSIKLNPSFRQAYLAMAETMYKQGKKEKAMGLFDKAVVVSPESQEVYLVRGLYLEKMGLLELAKENYKQGLEKIPYSTELKEKYNN